MITTVLVPIPPSVNNLWRIAARHDRRTNKRYSTLVRTHHYRQWLEQAVPDLRVQMGVFKSPVRTTLTIRGGPGFENDRDIDNCSKAVHDALVHAQRIKADTCRDIIHMEVIYLLPIPGKPARCWLTVQQARYEDYTIDEDDARLEE